MHLSTVNNIFNHQITNSDNYGWDCYGPNARMQDYTSDHATGTVVYDTKNFTVFEVTVCPLNDESIRPYRWIDPEFNDAYLAEAKKRNVIPDQAWDDVKYIDLETVEDFTTKASAIFNGKSFDTRIEVPIELDNEVLLQLTMQAHKRDITINQLVEEILRQLVAEHEPKS
jgi:hypothetical protein